MNRKTKIENKSKSKNKKSTTAKSVVNKSNTGVFRTAISDTPDKVLSNSNNVVAKPKPSYLELPIAHIKSDLIGIILFALIALGFILLLKYYDITLDLVLSYISTSFTSF